MKHEGLLAEHAVSLPWHGLRRASHCNCLTHWTTSLVRTTSRRFYCDRTDVKWPARRSHRARLFAGAWRAKLHLPGGSTLHEPERHQPVPVIHFPRSPRRAATNESAPMPHNDNYSAIELSSIFYGWRKQHDCFYKYSLGGFH